MPSTDDILQRPRALSTLVALLEKEPMTAREFTRASLYVAENAKLLREDLVAWGLITLRELPGRGAVGAYEIRLTPKGREVATHAKEIQRLAGVTKTNGS